jgi:hypothetical protein
VFIDTYNIPMICGDNFAYKGKDSLALYMDEPLIPTESRNA